jgi:acyl carrier protein
MLDISELKQVIAETLEVAEELLTLTALFKNDLGADSLDLVELAMALEMKYKIEVSDDDVKGINNLQDVINYLEGKV